MLIGTSKSAGTAVWAAAEAPELVSRLVLIGPVVRDTGSAWQARLLTYGLFGGPWGVGLWIRYLRTLFPSRQPDDLEMYFASLRANLSEPGRFAATRRMLITSNAASDERLGRVAAPALIIMGTKDRDFKDPAAEAQAIASRMNASTTIRLMEGAGHYPHAEMPDETARVVLDFAGGAERLRHGA
jgi:pimeloyl-ACP methyl ester carboxylesterase